MILLDTNVISEALRRPSNSNVEQWINAQTRTDLFLCVPVLAELRYGVERLPAGRRRDALDRAIRELETDGFADRILTLDNECASAYGKVLVRREKLGRPIGIMDGLIAAVTLVHSATLATRDIADFGSLGIDLVNPFAPA